MKDWVPVILILLVASSPLIFVIVRFPRTVITVTVALALVGVAAAWNPTWFPVSLYGWLTVAWVSWLFLALAGTAGLVVFVLWIGSGRSEAGALPGRLPWRDGLLTAGIVFSTWQVVGFIVDGLFAGARLDRFDATVWARNEPGEILSARARMLHDLIHRVLPGASREETLAWLGSPQEHWMRREQEGRPDEKPEVNVGWERFDTWSWLVPTHDGFGDRRYLVVHFDAQERADEVGTHVDSPR